jgi:predicted esterase
MRNGFRWLALALVLTVWACGAEAGKLEPNAILRFEFPNLPDTLAMMVSGQSRPVEFKAQLPENYSRDGRFPLCVYLGGGDGGRGDDLGTARAIAGPRDFVCVNLPLFKRAYNTNYGVMISLDDFQTVSEAYRVMLKKLLKAVPNISPERSALGGFSNGAHTTALLIAGRDEFILRHFQAFYFAEGGVFLAANALNKKVVKQCRFLFLRGDYLDSAPGAEGYRLRNQAIEQIAKAENLDFTTVVMRNTGHEFPPKYRAIAGQWIRGEKLPDIEKQ